MIAFGNLKSACQRVIHGQDKWKPWKTWQLGQVKLQGVSGRQDEWILGIKLTARTRENLGVFGDKDEWTPGSIRQLGRVNAKKYLAARTSECEATHNSSDKYL